MSPGLAITLVTSLVLGFITGTLMSLQSLCDGIESHKLFDDELFWELAEDDNPGYSLVTGEAKMAERRRKSRASRSHSLGKVGELGLAKISSLLLFISRESLQVILFYFRKFVAFFPMG